MNTHDTQALVISHEGRRAKVYKDSEGIPTIGIGCNLLRSEMKVRLSLVGADYVAVLAGTQVLTDTQITTLFLDDFGAAVAAVRALFPQLDELPDGVQSVLVDMAFNLGKGGLAAFVKFRAAITAGQWARAVYELVNSRLAKQVPVRVVDNITWLLRHEAAA